MQPGKQTIIRAGVMDFELPLHHKAVRGEGEPLRVSLTTSGRGGTYPLAAPPFEDEHEIIYELASTTPVATHAVGPGSPDGYPFPAVQSETERLQRRCRELGEDPTPFPGEGKWRTYHAELRRQIRDAERAG